MHRAAAGLREGPRPRKRRHVVLQLLGQESGGRHHRRQVDTGVVSHPLEQVDEVVGDDVAGSRRGEGQCRQADADRVGQADLAGPKRETSRSTVITRSGVDLNDSELAKGQPNAAADVTVVTSPA